MERNDQLPYYRPLPDEFEKHIERVQPVPQGKSVSRRLARTDTTYFAVNQLGLKPYSWQSAFWDNLNNGKSTAICSARQVGKTAALAIFALQACFYNTCPLPTTKKTRIIIVSKSEAQSKKVISDVREWMRVGDDRVHKLTNGSVENFFSREIARGQDSTNTKGFITFANGCEIISLPPTDSARGFTGSWLFLDEAAFFPEERVFTQTLRPIVSQTGNKIGMISTPNGQQGFFFKYFDPFNKSEEHEFERLWIPYTSLEMDDSQLVFARDQMRKQEFALGNEREFEQEHMASFNSSAESFFNPTVVDKCVTVEAIYDKYAGPCDVGVDFGVGKQSRTVVTISAKVKRDKEDVIRQLYQYEYAPDKDLVLVQDIQQLQKHFNIQRVIFEDCGAAEAHRQSAEKIGIPLFMFNPSRDKAKKYFALRAWMNQGRVDLLNVEEQTKQIKGMILENTASGRVKIYHGAGLRDDRVDSFMLSTVYLTEEESGFKVWDIDDYY